MNSKVAITATITILLALSLPNFVLAATTTEYTPSTKTVCNGNTCTKTLYSGTMFVEEYSNWVTTDKAKSLKGYWNVDWLETDPRYELQVIDYNYTSIKLCMNTIDSELNKDIPLKYCNSTENEKNKAVKSSKPCKEVKKLKFKDKSWVCETITTDEPLPNYNFTFGSASTTIQLQDANTENLEDTEVDEFNADTNYGSDTTAAICSNVTERKFAYFKFDITQLPAGINILSSTLKIVGYSNIWSNVSINHVYNQTWTEDVITWNNQPCGAGFTDGTNCNLTIADVVTPTQSSNSYNHIFDVLVGIKDDYTNSRVNSSWIMRMNDTIYKYKKDQNTKEAVSPSARPQLTLVYHYLNEPLWSSNQSSLPTEYNPTQEFHFNVTWNDSDTSVGNISLVYIETNISGTPTNYTMSNETYSDGIYNYSNFTTTLTPAQFYWKSWANTTDGVRDVWNVTDTWLFTIAQNTSTSNNLNATYGGTTYANTNINIESSDTLTLLCNNTITDSGTPTLYVDGTLKSNPNTGTWGTGTYTMVCNTSGNTNYTSNPTGITKTLTVTTPSGGSISGVGGGASISTIIFLNGTNITLPPLWEQPGIQAETLFFTAPLPYIGMTTFQMLLILILVFIPAYRKIKHKPLTTNDPILFAGLLIIVAMAFVVTAPQNINVWGTGEIVSADFLQNIRVFE